MNNKKISVVIPVYNAEVYIKDSIDSILNQTYQNIEIICIDDCSTDTTFNILSSIKDSRFFLYKNKKNEGVIFTRSRAYTLCTGDYIANMDADDIANSNRLEREVVFLNKHPDIDVVGSWISIIDKNSNYMRRWKTPTTNDEIKASLIFKMPIANPTVMFRSSLKPELTHNKEFFSVEDYALFCKLASCGYKFHNIKETLLKYRVLESSMSHFNEKNIKLRDNVHKLVYKKILNDIGIAHLNLDTHRLIMNGEITTQEQLNLISIHLHEIACNCPASYCKNKVLRIYISKLWAQSCLNASKHIKINFINSIFNQAFTLNRKALKIILKASIKSIREGRKSQ